MDDTILEGLSPSTNTTYDPHNNENITAKTSDNNEWEVPSWAHDRWATIKRDYTMEDVRKLQGSVKIKHTLAENGSKKLWELLHKEDYVATLGTYTGNMAVQQARAGLKAIYLSGWQVAADANSSGQMYPDQSLYPVNSVPDIVKRINLAFQRADQVQHMEKLENIETTDIDFFLPIIADAEAARLITSDIDERDHQFLTGERTTEGFYRMTGGIDCAIARGIAYAPYADLVWCETATPDLAEARKFAEALKKEHPDQMLAYNCSPSFNWKKHLDEAQMKVFQKEIAAMGYKFQFITLAGFHNLNYSTFKLAEAYKENGMAAYSELQQKEFGAEKDGYSATKHQREVGVSYFDAVSNAVTKGQSATTAMDDSTETDQF